MYRYVYLYKSCSSNGENTSIVKSKRIIFRLRQIEQHKIETSVYRREIRATELIILPSYEFEHDVLFCYLDEFWRRLLQSESFFSIETLMTISMAVERRASAGDEDLNRSMRSVETIEKSMTLLPLAAHTQTHLYFFFFLFVLHY